MSSVYKAKAKLTRVAELGGDGVKEGAKAFGYGKPLLLEFELDGKTAAAVLETMKGDTFGHEFPHDRAQALLLAHSAYNKLPRHVKAVDVGAFTKGGELRSLGDYEEFFILVEKAEGTPYYKDLERILREKTLTRLDELRCKALSNYLVEIHKPRKDAPNLYLRRLRELFGHGECIMGLIDNYPEGFVEEGLLYSIAEKCFKKIWGMRRKTHRLRQVHGDFHPWNVLFKAGAAFAVLDRSRGEWGEAADDLAAMSVNYLFFSLQAYGRLEGPFEKLFSTFVGNYLDETGDEEILEVIQPFYAWRGLVLASPVWYPNLKPDVRRRLFNFVVNVLESDRVEPKEVNSYLKER